MQVVLFCTPSRFYLVQKQTNFDTDRAFFKCVLYVTMLKTQTAFFTKKIKAFFVMSPINNNEKNVYKNKQSQSYSFACRYSHLPI